jgi:H+/Cl- antiporter ClcA
MFPNGVRDGQTNVQVYPGVYSVVGAAAFCGGITHTVSVAVIIFELTGQLVALLPVMVAVLIANAVCSYFQVRHFSLQEGLGPHISSHLGVSILIRTPVKN